MLSKFERHSDSEVYRPEIEQSDNKKDVKLIADGISTYIEMLGTLNTEQQPAQSAEIDAYSTYIGISESDLYNAIHDLLINYVTTNYKDMSKQIDYIKHYIDIYDDARAVIDIVYNKLHNYSIAATYIQYYNTVKCPALRVFIYYDLLYYNYVTDYNFLRTPVSTILPYLQPYTKITPNTPSRLKNYIADFEIAGQLRIYLSSCCSVRQRICLDCPRGSKRRANFEEESAINFYAILFSITPAEVDAHYKKPRNMSTHESRRKLHIVMLTIYRIIDSFYTVGATTSAETRNNNYYELCTLFTICRYIEQYSNICRAFNILRLIDVNSDKLTNDKTVELFNKVISAVKSHFNLDKQYIMFTPEQISLYDLHRDITTRESCEKIYGMCINKIMYVSYIAVITNYIYNHSDGFKPATFVNMSKICMSCFNDMSPDFVSLPYVIKMYDIIPRDIRSSILKTLVENIWLGVFPYIVKLYEFLIREGNGTLLPYIFVNLMGLSNCCYRAGESEYYIDRYNDIISGRYKYLFDYWIKNSRPSEFVPIYEHCIDNAYYANYIQSADTISSAILLPVAHNKVGITKQCREIDDILNISKDTAYLQSIDIFPINTISENFSTNSHEYRKYFTHKSPHARDVAYISCDFCSVYDSLPTMLWICKRCDKHVGHLTCMSTHIVRTNLRGHSCVDQLFD